MTPVGPRRAQVRTGAEKFSVTISAFGVRVRCWVSAPMLAPLRAALPPTAHLVPGPVTGAAWEVRSPDELAGVLQNVELQIAQYADGLIFVHAGAVAVDGRALLLPGRSGVGKSTLVQALVGLGATYLSDEFAPIAADGSVLPYRRPISIRATADRPARRWTPDTGRSRATSGPFPVGMVAHLHYVARAEEVWTPTGPGQAMFALIDNTVAARSRPQEMLAHHGQAVRAATGVTGARGEADVAARRLLGLMRATGGAGSAAGVGGSG